MENRFKYIVVGGGVAGASAVEGIRDRDRTGSIALFGNENRLPYDRPPLSKGLWLGKSTLEELPVHDDAYYKSHNVQLFVNNAITELIPSNRQVLDKEGNWYAYEKLLIATGGSPRTLPFGGEALHYFRTVDDYLRLKEVAERAEKFIVIGGGFIGAELTAALTMNGKKVTMIFPDRTILQRVLPADLSSFVTEYYETKDVTVVSNDAPLRANRSKNETTLVAKSGKQLSADAAIAAIGLDLHLEMVERSGVKVENGIVVNNMLQTSDRDIYAAGDVARFPAISLDEMIRIEHWDNAKAQGAHAGRNMTGANLPFEYLPYFYSDLFDLGFEAVGQLDSRMTTYADWKEKYREGVVYYLDDARVKGVLLWNVWGKLDAARKVIGAKRVYSNTAELQNVLDAA